SDQPTCFIAYTIKGWGLPFAAHKDNHSGLMTVEQVNELRRQLHIAEGREWEPLEGIDIPASEFSDAISGAPFNQMSERRHRAPLVPVPDAFEAPTGARTSTQEGFGRLMTTIARQHPDLADRIVTTAPDVTTSTNLGAWVNRRGIFDRVNRGDV